MQAPTPTAILWRPCRSLKEQDLDWLQPRHAHYTDVALENGRELPCTSWRDSILTRCSHAGHMPSADEPAQPTSGGAVQPMRAAALACGGARLGSQLVRLQMHMLTSALNPNSFSSVQPYKACGMSPEVCSASLGAEAGCEAHLLRAPQVHLLACAGLPLRCHGLTRVHLKIQPSFSTAMLKRSSHTR